MMSLHATHLEEILDGAGNVAIEVVEEIEESEDEESQMGAPIRTEDSSALGEEK